MNKEESLLDDETLFFAYYQAAIKGRSKSLNAKTAEEYSDGASWAVVEHRKYFPRRKRALK